MLSSEELPSQRGAEDRFRVERMADVPALWCEGSAVFRAEKRRRGGWSAGVRKENKVKHEGWWGSWVWGST